MVVNCVGLRANTNQESEFETAIDVNCKGVVNLCGAAVPLMLRAGSGHIVNVDLNVSSGDLPASSVYNASKAFATTFSKSLRAEFKGTGLRVTDIQPGEEASGGTAVLAPE